MTVRELYAFLNEKIPPSLSCDWDNDGLMCCPEPDADVKKVLIALDVCASVPYAVRGNLRMMIYWLAAATLTACVTYTGGKA